MCFLYLLYALRLRRLQLEYERMASAEIRNLKKIPAKQIYVFRNEAEKLKGRLEKKYSDMLDLIPENNIPIRKLWYWSENYFDIFLESIIQLEELWDEREDEFIQIQMSSKEGIRGLIIPFPRAE